MAVFTQNKYQTGHRVTAVFSVFFVLFCSFCGALAGFPPFLQPAVRAEAARQTQELLTLSTAKRMALANSEKIENLEVQMMAKDAAVNSAIRSLKEKERNMATFRWSPLLSFKFPTKPENWHKLTLLYKHKEPPSEGLPR